MAELRPPAKATPPGTPPGQVPPAFAKPGFIW
jgi:hypothetical protein